MAQIKKVYPLGKSERPDFFKYVIVATGENIKLDNPKLCKDFRGNDMYFDPHQLSEAKRTCKAINKVERKRKESEELKMNKTPYNQEFFNNIAAEFDTHVKQSIPYFSLVQQNIVTNLSEYFQNKRILDVCGSTGELGRQLLFGGWQGQYDCLDGSPEMEKVFNAVTPVGSKTSLHFVMAGFMGGWVDEFEGKSVKIPAFKPSLPEYNGEKIYDVAVESLGFQFFTKERRPAIQAMRKIAKTCIFFEKFNDSKNPEVWRNNERLKNEIYKPQFFTQEQIDAKQEQVLNDMGDYCYDIREFSGILQSEFKYVTRFARIGNFSGWVASDEPISWNKDHNLRINNYNSIGTF